MCLSCQYNRFQKCKICEDSMCVEQAHKQNIICQKCWKFMQKKRMCRQCKVIFPSGGQLFLHLNLTNHHKDYDKSVALYVQKLVGFDRDMTYETDIKRYFIRGFIP